VSHKAFATVRRDTVVIEMQIKLEDESDVSR
jgi:hypothetical protein